MARAHPCRARRCFGAQYFHPRRCNLITGDCAGPWYSSGKETADAQAACDRWGTGEFHIGYEMVPPGQSESSFALLNESKVWGLVDGAWRCGETVCNVAKGFVGAHVSADYRILPRNATPDECTWFAWVRGPAVRVVGIGDDDGELGVDKEQRKFYSNIFLYVFGALAALAIPVFAYMCATFLFDMTNKALFSEAHALQGPDLEYKRVRRPEREVRALPGRAHAGKRPSPLGANVLQAAGAAPRQATGPVQRTDTQSPASSSSDAPEHADGGDGGAAADDSQSQGGGPDRSGTSGSASGSSSAYHAQAYLAPRPASSDEPPPLPPPPAREGAPLTPPPRAQPPPPPQQRAAPPAALELT